MNQILIFTKTPVSLDQTEIKRVANQALETFAIDNAYMEIIFVDKDEIRELNEKHRKINTATDVLSFPQKEVPVASIKMLGSIVISEEVVLEKEEETPDVVKHGLLHLLGYDHEKNEAEWQKQATKIECNL